MSNPFEPLMSEDVWSVASVSEQPEATLRDWSLWEICSPVLMPSRSLHLVGYCIEDREGRATSRVVALDLKARRAETTSGRIYKLAGKPGWSSDADHTFRAWKRISSVAEAHDVAKRLLAMSKEPK